MFVYKVIKKRLVIAKASGFQHLCKGDALAKILINKIPKRVHNDAGAIFLIFQNLN